jgi:hypothetical protein
MRKLEWGLRPIGAYAYAPVGMRKYRAEEIEVEVGMRKAY